MGRSLHNVGLVELGRRNYESAEKYFDETLVVAKGLNYLYGVTTTMMNFGRLRYYQRRFDEAVDILNQCIVDSENIQHWERSAQADVLIGMCFIEMDKCEIAHIHFDKAVDEFGDLGKFTSAWYAITLAGLGVIAHRSGDHKQAHELAASARKQADLVAETNNIDSAFYIMEFKHWLDEIES